MSGDPRAAGPVSHVAIAARPPALRGKLDALKSELDRIEAIDHLKAPAGQRARDLWETTAKRLRAAERARAQRAARRRRGSLPPRGTHLGDAARGLTSTASPRPG